MQEFGFGANDAALGSEDSEPTAEEERAIWLGQEVDPSPQFDYSTWGPVNMVALLCPVCGNYNLHQGAIRAYHRDQEDGPGNLTVVKCGGVSVERVEDKDIPGRRDSMSISFWCEGGCRPCSLHIQQHKGTTYVRWEPDPLPPIPQTPPASP